jgi:WD40-like Beta Propeller Repeat
MRWLRGVARQVAVAVTVALTAIMWSGPAGAVTGFVNASTSDTGANSDFESSEPSLSSNGLRVAFSSQATNLDPADKDLTPDVYVKDLGSGDVVLVSAAPGKGKGKGKGPVKGNFASMAPAISGSGFLVAFHSQANNLLRADPFADFDVYIKDLSTGALRLVSSSDAGVKANSDSFAPTISTNGRFVTFSSGATNLDPADPDPGIDVYVKDLSTGDVRLVSSGPSGRGNGPSFDAIITPDGMKVVFASNATNFGGDSNPDADVFLKNLSTGAVTLVSKRAGGVSGTGDSFHGVPSNNGTVIAFTSRATDLVPADTDVYEDVFVKNLSTGQLVLVSPAANGDGQSAAHAVSRDGILVAFSSSSTTLLASDTDVLLDVYVRNLTTGALVLASSSGGVKGNGDSFGASFDASADTISFASTSTNLVPADTDGRSDVYVAQF